MIPFFQVLVLIMFAKVLLALQNVPINIRVLRYLFFECLLHLLFGLNLQWSSRSSSKFPFLTTVSLKIILILHREIWYTLGKKSVLKIK